MEGTHGDLSNARILIMDWKYLYGARNSDGNLYRISGKNERKYPFICMSWTVLLNKRFTITVGYIEQNNVG